MTVEQNDTRVTIKNGNASLEILKFGATVISWQMAAVLDGSKAVRGGIPLVFPVFGKAAEGACAKLPQHGFARTHVWEFLGQTTQDPPTVQFALSPDQLSETAKDQWGYDFCLIYTVSLRPNSLDTKLTVRNTDSRAWDFKALYHTYLRVPDISQVAVQGLVGTSVSDSVVRSKYIEQSSDIAISAEVDRVYESVPGAVNVAVDGATLFNFERSNLPDVVVWNPWVEKAQSLADFHPKTGYNHMICIENGSVVNFTTLDPQESWEGSQTITAYD